MGVIPNPKMALIFPISCVLVLIFPIFMIYFRICEGKGSFPKYQIKSLDRKIRSVDGKPRDGDPRDGFFYPTLTLMIDSFYLTWV